MRSGDQKIEVRQFNAATILPLKTVTVPPYTTTNTIIYGLKKFIVIDPAPLDKAHQEFLVNYIKNRIECGDSFLGIYLTHHHGDHCGAAEIVKQYFKIPVAAHESAASLLSCDLDIPLKGSEHIDCDPCVIRIIHTPGHADSHLVFYEEQEKTLVAGDMVTDRGCVLIPPGSGSLKVYLESMQSLTKLNINAIIPAHGQVIENNAQAFLLRAIRHRLGRIAAILEVLDEKEQALDATDLTLAVYKNTTSESLMPFAQLSVESSLSWLLAEGLVIKNKEHRWQSARDKNKKEQSLLSVMKELDERLRYS